MGKIFRYDRFDADQRDPRLPLATRRAPTNVPYVVDNLWEWRRPETMPNRRHSVYASPKPELAAQFGGAIGGRVYSVDVTGASVAQIAQQDAREHPEVKKLSRFMTSLLKQSWLDGPAITKIPEALLWAPCLTQAEVEWIFTSERLAPERDNVWKAIEFWNEARLVESCAELPFPEGEIFFEAETWSLLPIDPA